MTYLLLIALITSFSASAETMKVVARNRSMNLSPIDIQIDELGLDNDGEHFKYFNVVKGVNEEALPLRELSEQERLRTLTLGYHLNRARNYFINILKADHLKNLGKITVRYDMARSFNTGKHFTSNDVEYNNAVTHKGSNQYSLPEVKKWGNEIWFRPAKNEEVKAPRGSIPDQDVQDELLSLADSAIIDVTKNKVIGLGAYAFNSGHYVSQLSLILIMKKIIPNILDFIITSVPFKMGLDSAMVPEIAYHEFAHVALSDYVPLTGSFAVSEGIANYFAAIISGNTAIADKLGEYGNSISPIDINNRLRYSTRFEINSNLAHHPFTYNYLWKMRDRVSKEITVTDGDSAFVFDRIVFGSRKYIDFSSDLTISKSLPEALMKATSDVGLDRYTARDMRLIIAQTAKNIGM